MLLRSSEAIIKAAQRANDASKNRTYRQYGPILSEVLSAGVRTTIKWEWLNREVYSLKGKFATEEVKYVVELLNETIKVLTDTSTRRIEYWGIVNRCINFVHHNAEGNRALEKCKYLTETIIGYLVECDIKEMPKVIPLPSAIDWEDKRVIRLPVRVYHVERIIYAELKGTPIWRLPLTFIQRY